MFWLVDLADSDLVGFVGPDISIFEFKIESRFCESEIIGIDIFKI